METVDTKQLDELIRQTYKDIHYLKVLIAAKESKLEKLVERKKSIELYNKKS